MIEQMTRYVDTKNMQEMKIVLIYWMGNVHIEIRHVAYFISISKTWNVRILL